MARGGLTDRMVKQAKAGVLLDGYGLRLRVSRNPTNGRIRKSWVLRVTVRGGPMREIGLGSAVDISLKEARERASKARRMARDGIDPLETRRAELAAKAAERARMMTFRQCAEAYIEAHKAGWRNEKHAAQWPATLNAYVYPVLGDLAVKDVDVSLVLRVLEPIWTDKTETASRVRQRIEAVLNWAKARGLRQGENPALWRGHLDKLLPAPGRVSQVEHHEAMAYRDVPQLMRALASREGVAPQALRFLILTATRTSETLNARWSEIDLQEKVWRIPSERMKAKREHRVPLCADALAILSDVKPQIAGDDDFVFPGAKAGRPLSNMVFLTLLKRMGHQTITAHGFRSAFRDWAAERTNFAREIAEAALAHVLGDKVEAAYRRTDLFDKRRRLMEAWAKHCASVSGDGEVVALRANG